MNYKATLYPQLNDVWRCILTRFQTLLRYVETGFQEGYCRDSLNRGRQSGDVLKLRFAVVEEARPVKKTEIDEVRKTNIADIGKALAFRIK